MKGSEEVTPEKVTATYEYLRQMAEALSINGPVSIEINFQNGNPRSIGYSILQKRNIVDII